MLDALINALRPLFVTKPRHCSYLQGAYQIPGSIAYRGRNKRKGWGAYNRSKSR